MYMTFMYFSLSIYARLLWFDHLKASVWAASRTDAAMAANDWFFCFRVEIHRTHDTGRFAFAATYAHIFPNQHAAPGPFFKGIARTYLHARRFPAPKAHDSYEVAGHAACRAYLYRAFDKRVVFFVDKCAYAHAGEAAKAFVHFLCL
jgi:hypothetical protein